MSSSLSLSSPEQNTSSLPYSREGNSSYFTMESNSLLPLLDSNSSVPFSDALYLNTEPIFNSTDIRYRKTLKK